MIDLKGFSELRGVIIGVTSAEPLAPAHGVTERRRLDPRLTLPGAQSVVAVGVPMRGVTPGSGGLRGQVAACMSGADYHETVLEELKAAAGFLGSPSESAFQADAGPLYERGFAVRAGLGFQGRNGCVFSEKYGSYFNIGLLLTPLSLPVDAPSGAACPSCGACAAACPTGALDNGFERGRCIAAITQKKGELTEAEQAAIGDRLWGCDACQRACPLNAGKAKDGDAPLLDEIDAMGEAAFRARFPAAAWRGLETFKRNAAIARRNAAGERGRAFRLL